jgi:hypothetical protein
MVPVASLCSQRPVEEAPCAVSGESGRSCRSLMRWMYSSHLRESRAWRHLVFLLFTGPGWSSAVIADLALKRAVLRARASGSLIPMCAAESVDGGEYAFLLFLGSVASVGILRAASSGSTRAFFLHFLLDFALVFGCILAPSSYRRVNSVAPSQCWTFQSKVELSRGILFASRCSSAAGSSSSAAGSSRLVCTPRVVVIFGAAIFKLQTDWRIQPTSLQGAGLGELDACDVVACEVRLVIHAIETYQRLNLIPSLPRGMRLRLPIVYLYCTHTPNTVPPILVLHTQMGWGGMRNCQINNTISCLTKYLYLLLLI